MAIKDKRKESLVTMLIESIPILFKILVKNIKKQLDPFHT